MLHSIWKKLTGQERLYHIERKLQKKMLKCEHEEEWKKLNQRRKQIRRKRLHIQKYSQILLIICALLLTAGIARGIVFVHTGGWAKKQNQTTSPEAGKSVEEKIAGAIKNSQDENGMPAEDKASTTEILLSFTGDCILGTDEYFAWDTGLPAYYDLYGPEYFLKNVRSIFEEDNLTIVNMEGTLTEETTRVDKQFAFKGDPDYVKILTSSSVEAANVANNHSHDYGEKSFQDTVQTLEKNGIRTFGYDDVAVLEVKGIRVGMFGIYELDDHLERIPQVKQDIAKLKAQQVDIIVAVFHWSNELVTVPDNNQVTLAHLAIDEGADVVVGHHPHVVQGIDEYKGKTIAYSLGNFCFGGNTHPTEMDTFIFQQKFTLNGKKDIIDSEYKVIPCRVSSEENYNDYQPTPLRGEEAEETLNKIRERSQAIHQDKDGTESETAGT